MRRFLFIICVLFCVNLNAQLPAFPFDSTFWVVDNVLWFHARAVYTTGSDSIINGTTYTTIWTDYYTQAVTDTDNLELFIRPDTTNRVLFRYASSVSSDTNEYVLYDFSLQAGDTFVVHSLFLNGPQAVTVNQVYYSQLNDGTPIKVVDLNFFQPSCTSLRLIEMIGDMRNPFYPLIGHYTAPDTCVSQLICERINGQSVYGVSNCDIDMGTINMSPPACKPERIGDTDNEVLFRLDCADGKPVHVTTYDMQGRILSQGSFSPEAISVFVEKTQLIVARFQWGNDSASIILTH